MSLRDLIKENHDKAENHRFIKLLLSNEITKEIYADLLLNQLFCYTKLEILAKHYGLLEGVEEICRASAIETDYIELFTPAKIYSSTAEYVEYLLTVPKEKLMGHVYAKHFGDLYGGQMIKKVVPGSGRMYEFENRKELIEKMRERLSDDLGDEANVALDFALKLFDEIAEAHNLPESHEKEPV